MKFLPYLKQMGKRLVLELFHVLELILHSFLQMVQATIALEDMIRTEYLKNEWWYWSSLSAAAKISTVSSLALRIFSLDAAIIYEKISPNQDSNDYLDTTSSIPEQKLGGVDLTEKPRTSSRKSGKKRKEPEG